MGSDRGLISLVPNGYGVDIDEAGQILGYDFTSLQLPLPSHAFFYDDGQFLHLGSLGRTHASASDINAEGQAMGWAYSGSGGFFNVGQLGWYYDGQSMRNLNRLIDPALAWWSHITTQSLAAPPSPYKLTRAPARAGLPSLRC